MGKTLDRESAIFISLSRNKFILNFMHDVTNTIGFAARKYQSVINTGIFKVNVELFNQVLECVYISNAFSKRVI